MGSKVDVPATTDPTATDWQNFIAWVEKAQTGKINITFSNMDNTSEPKIQAGSIVEIAGSLYSFSAEEAATGWSGIANSTQAYMRLVASGDTVSAEWTTTAPTYRDDLQGWYESGTNKRYVLRCYRDGSGNYTIKRKYRQDYGNKYDVGDNTFSGDNTINATEITGLSYGSVGTYVIAASTAWSIGNQYLPGTTVAGNSLIRSTFDASSVSSPFNAKSDELVNVDAANTSLGLSGTWELMTRVNWGSSNTGIYPVGLFLRIS